MTSLLITTIGAEQVLTLLNGLQELVISTLPMVVVHHWLAYHPTLGLLGVLQDETGSYHIIKGQKWQLWPQTGRVVQTHVAISHPPVLTLVDGETCRSFSHHSSSGEWLEDEAIQGCWASTLPPASQLVARTLLSRQNHNKNTASESLLLFESGQIFLARWLANSHRTTSQAIILNTLVGPVCALPHLAYQNGAGQIYELVEEKQTPKILARRELLNRDIQACAYTHEYRYVLSRGKFLLVTHRRVQWTLAYVEYVVHLSSNHLLLHVSGERWLMAVGCFAMQTLAEKTPPKCALDPAGTHAPYFRLLATGENYLAN